MTTDEPEPHGGSSLVLCSRMVTRSESGLPVGYCPRRAGLWYFDAESYEPLGFGPRCGSAWCPGCLPYVMWKQARIIGACNPSRYAVLTGVQGDDYPSLRVSVKRFLQRLRRQGFGVRGFWCCEVNPRGTGWHLNLWWWGPDVPQEYLSESAQAVGWGEVAHVKRWQSRRRDGYGFKEVAYGMKEARAAADYGLTDTTVRGAAADYLTRNGGKLMHATSGRWSPYRLGVGGQEFTNARDYWLALRDFDGYQPSESRPMGVGFGDPETYLERTSHDVERFPWELDRDLSASGTPTGTPGSPAPDPWCQSWWEFPDLVSLDAHGTYSR